MSFHFHKKSSLVNYTDTERGRVTCAISYYWVEVVATKGSSKFWPFYRRWCCKGFWKTGFLHVSDSSEPLFVLSKFKKFTISILYCKKKFDSQTVFLSFALEYHTEDFILLLKIKSQLLQYNKRHHERVLVNCFTRWHFVSRITMTEPDYLTRGCQEVESGI